jgi:hypothetical protein
MNWILPVLFQTLYNSLADIQMNVNFAQTYSNSLQVDPALES